jgi:hypothetical protein
MDHTERVSGPEQRHYEAMAKMEAYEAVMFEAIRLLEYARRTSDVERAKAVLEKALEGTRYDRSSAV